MSKWCPKLSPALRASIGDDERQKETQHWEHHRDDLIHSVVATVSKIQIYDEVVPKFRFCRLSQETGLGLIGDIAHRDVADSCKSCSESHRASRTFSIRIGNKSSVPWASSGILGNRAWVTMNETWNHRATHHENKHEIDVFPPPLYENFQDGIDDCQESRITDLLSHREEKDHQGCKTHNQICTP